MTDLEDYGDCRATKATQATQDQGALQGMTDLEDYGDCRATKATQATQDRRESRVGQARQVRRDQPDLKAHRAAVLSRRALRGRKATQATQDQGALQGMTDFEDYRD